MQPDHLSRLKAAGVWPEGLIYTASASGSIDWFVWDGCTWVGYDDPIAHECCRALLIDKMMDELPLQWYMKPVESEVPDPDHGRRWRVDSHRIVDRFLPSYPDKFEALFQALVASGRVK